MKRVTLLLLLLLSSFITFAQEIPRKEIDLQQLLDEILGYQDEDLNYEEAYDNYLQYLSNPLDLNKAEAGELRNLFILNEQQIQSFIKYRQENGPLLSDYELQAVPNFNLETIQKLLPFVKITDPSTKLSLNLFKNILSNNNSYLLLRAQRTLELDEGYQIEDSLKKFLGIPEKLFVRFKGGDSEKIQMGFTLEQDAGEPFRWNSNQHHYAVDYFSGYVQTKNKQRWKNIIVGDYQLQAGQGLLLGGGFNIGKGGETVNTLRRTSQLGIPNSGAMENTFLRGFNFTYAIHKNHLITPFASQTFRDASQGNDTTDQMVSSLLQSGLHRNEQELLKRKNLKEIQYGTIYQYKKENLEAGLVYHHIIFNKSISREPRLYNQFFFQGKSLTSISTFINYTFYNFSFFGEFAKNYKAGNGFIIGSIGSLTPSLDLALSFRNYQRDYHTFSGNALSESTAPQNEKGFYWGLKYKLNRSLTFGSYVDLFEFLWLRYRSYQPSYGYEYLFRINFQPTKQIVLSTQFREESKLRNLPTTSNFYETAQGVKRNMMVQANYTTSGALSMRTRVQFSEYHHHKTKTNGIVLLQDISYDFGKLKISARYALFDTDDYDNRQYVSERDVWLAYSLPAYYGSGIKQYALLQYDFSDRITAWFRIAQLSLQHQESIGSGLDEIKSSDRNDLSFQLRIKI